MALNWNSNKETIHRFYLTEDKTLEEVRTIMKTIYNFQATKAQYETQFKRWGFRKKFASDEWPIIQNKLQERAGKGKKVEYTSTKSWSRTRQLGGRSRGPRLLTPTGVSFRTSSSVLRPVSPKQDNLPIFQLQEIFDTIRLVGLPNDQPQTFRRSQIEPNPDLFPGAHTNPTFVSFPPSPVIPTFGLHDHVLSSNHLFDMQMENMLMQPVNEIPSAVISSLFKRLFTGETQTETTVLRQDLIGKILPCLQVEMLERYDGELKEDFERLLGSCYGEAPLHVIKFALYFSSNNMLTQEQVDDFLAWIVSNGERTVPTLKALLCYNLPTIEACVQTIFRRAISIGNVSVAKILLESDVDLSTAFMSSQLDLQETIEAEDIELIRLLLKAGAKLNEGLLKSAVRTGNTELVQLLLQGGCDFEKFIQDEEDDIAAKYPGTLLQAAETAEMVRLLLDSGFEVDALGYDSFEEIMTSLQVAIRNGYSIEVIRTLIEGGANVNAPGYGRKGQTPLMMAVQREDIEVVEELLGSGAQVNIYSTDYEVDGVTLTELQKAARMGSYDTVQMLLDAGADVNKPASGRNGKTALQKTADEDFEGVFRLLLDAGAELNAPSNARAKHPRSALLAAVENGNVELVQDLLDAGADVNAPAFGIFGSNAFEAALAIEGWKDDDRDSVISRMLAQNGADINLSVNNSHRGYELQKAVSRADIKTIQFLLSLGVDVNMALKDNGVGMILSLAIKRTADVDSQLVELLLREGADVNAQGKDETTAPYEPTALQEAVRKGNMKLVRLLLKEGADSNAPGGYRGTALEIAIEQGNFAMVQILLHSGAEVNVPVTHFSQKWTPLHRASMLKNKEAASQIIKLLLGKRPFLNIPPAYNKGRTILQSAIETSKTIHDCSVARILIEAGENINAPAAHEAGRTALQLAVAEGNLEIVRFLLSEGANINAPAGHVDGRTALQLAVENANKTANFVLIDFLLENGADVNGLPGYERGRSALQIVTTAENASMELIERLLNAGANVNLSAGTSRGLTALQGAAIQGHAKVASILIKAGANVNAPGAKHHGRTALEGAAEHGRLDMVQFLLNAGADSHLPPKRRYVRAAELAEGNSSLRF